jgi:hypothetical protein
MTIKSKNSLSEEDSSFEKKPNLSFEFFRAEDMLHLKYYFFNAMDGAEDKDEKLDKNYIYKLDSDQEMLVYVCIPSQHIAEDLFTGFPPFTDPLTVIAKKSFLAGKSWLAFRTLQKKIHKESLLNWEENFELITLDPFIKSNDGNVLEKIANEFGKINEVKKVDETQFNFIKKKEEYWPLTKFEIPYKMYLSPIAEPLSEKNKLDRKDGHFSFLKDNKSNVPYNDKGIKIIRPWENRLVFKDLNNIVTNPRFKVVHYFGQDSIDAGIEFLPAPIHREELKGLTMLPETDRDVVSDFFETSVLGGSIHFKYKNEDPLKHAVVAWEQDVKNARDNYVSITYRAIDVFTGLKLLISLVAERKYLKGICYLQKRYFINYSEKEKTYSDSLVVSKVPFTKIIPKSKGSYFSPVSVFATNNGSYLVAEEGSETANPGSQPCSTLLNFEYIGIDKDGKEHPFTSKIVFLMAETYQITKGVYKYEHEKEKEAYGITSGAIKIKHIGHLNPKYRKDLSPDQPYVFGIKKTFSDANKEVLKKTLVDLRTYITANISCFKININSPLTYGKIEALKKEKLIDQHSSNASYKTKDILMFSEGLNESLTGSDNFLYDFPIIPKLYFAEVIISQIDQLEGHSKYRLVDFADSYLKGNVEIDEPSNTNIYRLLFRMISLDANGKTIAKPLNDFFSNNYKSAGGMVNPGITISNLSVLNNGITYNEDHNKGAAKSTNSLTGIPTTLNTTSIFSSLDAEILGIPIREIVSSAFPIDDMPVFAFLEEAEKSIEKVNSLIAEFENTYKGWKKEYDDLQSQIKNLINEVKSLETKIKSFLKGEASVWFETLLEVSRAKEFYESAENIAKVYTENADNFKKLAKIPTAIIQETGIDIKTYLDALISKKLDELLLKDNLQKSIDNLLEKVIKVPAYTPEYLSTVIVIYCQDKKLADLSKLATEISRLKDTFSDEKTKHYNALINGIREAISFQAEIIIGQKELIKKQLENTINTIPTAVKTIVQPLIAQIGNYQKILAIYKLKDIHDNYHKIYSDFKGEYYNALSVKLKIVEPTKTLFDIAQIEASLTKKLIEEIDQISGLVPEVKAFTDWLKEKVQNNKQILSTGYELLRTNVEEQVLVQLLPYLNIVNQLNKIINDERKKLEKQLKSLMDMETLARNFVRTKIDQVKNEIENKKNDLIKYARGTSEYIAAYEFVTGSQRLIKKLEEISKQDLNYSFRTKKFRKASIGNIISFVPDSSTELSVKVKYQLEFDITELNQAPRIAKQSFLSDSYLKNFKIGFLQLIYMDFEQVRFLTGSEIKDDFQVKIRGVKFAGCLDFVQAFQEYLNTISNNLVFEITANWARVAYAISLPGFTAGYFNFFNFNLSAVLTLPFDPKKSLQFQFGFGSPLNKFGITVAGVFGGQGYFNLIAEPKRGIVGMEVVLEFGAIFNLNAGPISGTAYLVGGIYIKKYDSVYDIRAYILAVGRFNIIGLFSANLSFYLGLHENGDCLEGVCTVTASKRFTRWLEVSVSCTYPKTLRGTKKSNNNESFSNKVLNEGEKDTDAVLIRGSNLSRKRHYQGDEISLILEFPENAEVPRWEIIDEKDHKIITGSFEPNRNKANKTQLASLSLEVNKLKPGTYHLHLHGYDKKFNIAVVDENRDIIAADMIDSVKSKDKRYNYYASYYKKLQD